MSSSLGRINSILNILHNHKRTFVSLLPSDYQEVHKMTYLRPDRVIREHKNPDKIAFYMFNTQRLMEALKNVGNFKSKEEVKQHIEEAYNDFNS